MSEDKKLTLSIFAEAGNGRHKLVHFRDGIIYYSQFLEEVEKEESKKLEEVYQEIVRKCRKFEKSDLMIGTYMKAPHKNAKVTIKGKETEIDDAILPLVSFMNDHEEYRTVYSCGGSENGPKYEPYIMFMVLDYRTSFIEDVLREFFKISHGKIEVEKKVYLTKPRYNEDLPLYYEQDDFTDENVSISVHFEDQETLFEFTKFLKDKYEKHYNVVFGVQNYEGPKQ